MAYYHTDERTLSFSEISKYLGCKKDWYYSYHLGLKPKYLVPRMYRGSLVDHGLTEAIKAQDAGMKAHDCVAVAADEVAHEASKFMADPFVASICDADSGAKKEAEHVAAGAITIAERAVRSLELGTGRWTTLKSSGVPLLQFEMCMPLGLLYTFRGFLDWAAYDAKDDSTKLIDTKVRDQIRSEGELQFDYQLPLYQYALKAMYGVSIDMAGHFQVRSIVPKTPKALKSGAISRAACDTTWEVYSDAVIDAGLDPTDYEDMKPKLASADQFDRMTMTYRGADELFAIRHEAQEIAEDIERTEKRVKAIGGIAAPRRLNIMQCRGCRNRDLCMADLRGHDTTELIELRYSTREQRRMERENAKSKPNQA